MTPTFFPERGSSHRAPPLDKELEGTNYIKREKISLP